MPRKPSRRVAVTVVLLALLLLISRDDPRIAGNPAGTFSFAALGDAPYSHLEPLRYRIVLREIDRHELAWVLHIGDIFWYPCSDANYRKTLEGFDGLRHPVIYTPGDNEWTDCWEGGSGGYAPLERLQHLRRVFYPQPNRTLGGKRLTVTSQAESVAYREFVENARWEKDGITFATLHIVGSANGMKPFPSRTPNDDREARRRLEAAIAWLRETFAEAARRNSTAVVIAYHTSLAILRPAGHADRAAVEPFLAALEEEVERYGKPVLAIHGSDHEFIVDKPLVSRKSSRPLTNFTRLEVPGSPDVGWVRVTVRPGAVPAFSFENRVVPRWKLW